MTEVLFILPGEDGWATPSGNEFRHSFSENDPISSLFDVIRKQSRQDTVHLALEVNGNSLGEIHPQSPGTVTSFGLLGARIDLSRARIIVSFHPA
jgi:hypothetical protein